MSKLEDEQGPTSIEIRHVPARFCIDDGAARLPTSPERDTKSSSEQRLTDVVANSTWDVQDIFEYQGAVGACAGDVGATLGGYLDGADTEDVLVGGGLEEWGAVDAGVDGAVGLEPATGFGDTSGDVSRVKAGMDGEPEHDSLDVGVVEESPVGTERR